MNEIAIEQIECKKGKIEIQFRATDAIKKYFISNLFEREV